MGKWFKGRVSADGAIGVAIGALVILATGVVSSIILTAFYESALVILAPLIFAIFAAGAYIVIALRSGG